MGRARNYKEPTLEELKTAAAQYSTKMKFKRAYPNLYSYAYGNGLLPEICGHMFDARREWTEAKLQEEAAKYLTKGEFMRGSNKAYQAAAHQGFLNKICEHMTRTGGSYDMIYILRSPGTDIYKVGVTSKRLGFNRIETIRKATTIPMELFICMDIPEASFVERLLLTQGSGLPTTVSSQGSSEFREFSKEDMLKVMEILTKEAVR